MICKERVYKTIVNYPGLICKEYAKRLKATPSDVREALNLLQYYGRVNSAMDRRTQTYKWYTKDQGANSLSGKLVRQIWNGDIVL